MKKSRCYAKKDWKIVKISTQKGKIARKKAVFCRMKEGKASFFEDLFGFSVFRGKNIFEKEIDKPRKK